MSPSLPRRWSKWFGRRRDGGKAPARPRSGFRPAFEHLEDRVVPAVRVWSGGSALTANWSDGANWVGGAAPVAGDDLLFPGGGLQAATSNNDFGANQRFSSVTIDGSGYTLSGSAISLDSGGLTMNSATAGGVDTVALGITLLHPTSITDTYAGTTLNVGAINLNGQALTVGGSGTVSETGAITGTAGLTKLGSGTLVMQTPSSGTDNYTGATAINAGAVRVAAGAALGTGAVTVASGASLQLLGGATFTQALTLNGTGPGGGLPGSTAGALEAVGSATVTGAMTLGNDAVIGADAGVTLSDAGTVTLNGHTLGVNAGAGASALFSGAVNNGTGAGNLLVNGALTSGTVSLRAADGYTGSTNVEGGTLSLSLGGTAAATSAIGVALGGTLALDNTAAANSARVNPAAPITLVGGNLQIVGNATTGVTESIGNITLGGGQSNISVTPGKSTIITAAGLTHDTGATVNFNSTGTLGSATDQFSFTAAPPSTTTNGGAAAMMYATVNNGDFAANTANGVAAFNGYFLTNNISTAPANSIVKLTGNANVTANNAVPIAGLVTNGFNVSIGLGITLAIGNSANGGGLLMSGNSLIAPGGGGQTTLSFPGEGFLFAEGTGNEIDTPLAGTHGIDFAGATNAATTLTLNPGALGSAITGGSFIDSANLSVQGANPLGAGANTIVLVGGALGSASAAYRLTNPVGIAGGDTTLNSANLTLGGVVTVGPSTAIAGLPNVLNVAQPAAITGSIAGSGGMVETGTSSLLLSPSLRSTFSGGTILAGGTLVLGSAAGPLGVGSLTLTGSPASGSTLQNSVAGGITLNNPLVLSNAAPAAGANVVIGGAQPFTFTAPVSLTGQNVVQVNAATTITGAVSGPGGLTQAGTGTLTLGGTNTYTGATMVTGGGTVNVNGAQPGSAVGVVNGTLQGGGSLGFVTVGALGSDSAGPIGNGGGVQSATGANFSEGGNLTVQVMAYVNPGSDFGSLNLGSGPLVVGGSSAAPSTITLDLNNLTVTGQANGVAQFGTAYGTSTTFSELRIRNNPSDFAANLSYPGGEVNVIITAPMVNGTVLDPRTTTNVPSGTFVWTGASGGDPSWRNAANWLGGVAPDPSRPPLGGVNLVFPAGAAQLSVSNDFPIDSVFNSITIEGAGYTLAGNNVTLDAGLYDTVQPDAVGNSPVTNILLGIDETVGHGNGTTIADLYAGNQLVLAGGISTVLLNITIDGAGNTQITGPITGTGGLTKNGSGELDVFPAGSTGNSYTGTTTLAAGLTVINNGNALGSDSAAGISVKVGATLETLGPPTTGLTIKQGLSLAGFGVAGPVPGGLLGALYATEPLTLMGGVTLPNVMNGNALIVNNAGTSGAMTVSGGAMSLDGNTLQWVTNGQVNVSSGIVDGPGSPKSSIVFDGLTQNGKFTLSGANTFAGHTVVQSGTVTLTGSGTLSGTSDIDLDTNNLTVPNKLYLNEHTGVLVVDDSSSAAKLNANANLNLQGGRLIFKGAANAASKEQLASINVVAGQSFLYMEAGTGPLASLELDAGQMTHTPGATVDFSWSGKLLGGAANIIHYTAVPATDASGIFPYASFSQQPLDFQGNPIAGIQPINQSFAGYDDVVNKTVIGVSAGAGLVNGAGRVLVNGLVAPNVTVTTPITIDALQLTNGATVTIAPGGSLTILAALLTSGTGGGGIIGGGGPLTLGGDGNVMAYAATTLGAKIGGGSALTLAGNSTIHLSPTNGNNTYTGGTNVDAGFVSVDNTSSPFGGGNITFYGGALVFPAALGSSVSFSNGVNFDSSNTNFLPGGTGSLSLVFNGNGTLTGFDPLRQIGLSLLSIGSNLTMTFNGALTDLGAAAANQSGGFVVTGGGTLALANAGNTYSAGTTLAGSAANGPTVLLGSGTSLGAGPLTLGGGTLEANAPATIPNAVNLFSGTTNLGAAAPNNGTLVFSGPVTLNGAGTLIVSPNISANISGPTSGTGSLNSVGALTISGNGPNVVSPPNMSAATANSGGPIEIDGKQANSPVAVTGTHLQGTGSVGYLSVGAGGTVEPGTAGFVGTLTTTGQAPIQGFSSSFPPPPPVGTNFSNSGTLYLRVQAQQQGTDGPGVFWDQLDLTSGGFGLPAGSNPLIVGGTSRLVLDLAGLSGLSQITTFKQLIVYNERLGNIPVFNEVDIVNNPNNYVVELDYQKNELDLQIALGSIDQPLVALPAAQTTGEDLPLTLSALNHNAVVVSDPGAGLTTPAIALSATVSVNHGKLMLGNAGVVSGVMGNGTASVTFSGTVAAINQAITGLVYTPAGDFVGTDALTVTITNPGVNPPNSPQLLGTAQMNPPTVMPITVLQTADAPSFKPGINQSANDNAGLVTIPSWATMVQGEPPFQASMAGLVFSTTNDNPTLFASQPQVTLVASNQTGTLTYTPQLNEGGIAHVTVKLSNGTPDQDGDTDSFSATFTITVANHNPAAVTGVTVHWGKSSASLASLLGTTPLGGTGLPQDLPFAGINAIDLTFNQTVSPLSLNFSVMGLGVNYLPAGVAPTIVGPNTLEWRLATPLASANGYDNITLGLAGVTLPGALSNFKVLVGDVNGDGKVDLNDQLAVTRNLAIRYTTLAAAFLDVDGSGSIDMNDYSLVRKYTGNKIH